MLLILIKKATENEIQKVAADLDGYIKVVVDINQRILAAGGERHFEAEQELLKRGSKQENLWGGGLDLETGEIDYNSVINLRPQQNNSSRDILSTEMREKFSQILKKILK